jgi:hypothetical protein
LRIESEQLRPPVCRPHSFSLGEARPPQKEQSVDVRTLELEAENARFKRVLAEQTEDLTILKMAEAYIAKNQK